MPYKPQFQVTSHLLKTIEAISAFRQKIMMTTVQVPWIPVLQKDARARTTHSSTAIEGNPLTLEEVRALEEGQPLLTATERARREVLNHFAALRFVEKHQKQLKISTDDLLRLHKIIAAGVMDQGQAGVYRTFGVYVGAYVPPTAKVVPKMMEEYLQWWNQKSTEWSPVISSAILHYHFEEIHPFGDGNGRMGRILALWELYKRGFDTHHIFSVDEVFWEDRPLYYSQLAAVHNAKGDLTGWLEYSAAAIHLTLERVLERIDRLTKPGIGTNIVLTAKQEQLLNLLRNQGALAPPAIWKALKITKQGTMKVLNPLLDAGLVRRIGTRKSGKYLIN